MNTVDKQEITTEESDLELVKSLKINDQVEVNFYKKENASFVGISHFKFEDEILFKQDTMNKIIEAIQLVSQENAIKAKIEKLENKQD